MHHDFDEHLNTGQYQKSALTRFARTLRFASRVRTPQPARHDMWSLILETSLANATGLRVRNRATNMMVLAFAITMAVLFAISGLTDGGQKSAGAFVRIERAPTAATMSAPVVMFATFVSQGNDDEQTASLPRDNEVDGE